MNKAWKFYGANSVRRANLFVWFGLTHIASLVRFASGIIVYSPIGLEWEQFGRGEIRVRRLKRHCHFFWTVG